MEHSTNGEKNNTLNFELVQLGPETYKNLEFDNLVGELQRLIKNAPVDKIGKHVSQLKRVFDGKFKEVESKEKDKFIALGGHEIDFTFQLRAKKEFYELYKEYRQKRDEQRINFERKVKENLLAKQEIIESIKSLISVEENINTTFSTFKELQAKWRSLGPVPKTEADNLWANYHHHIERFYDFLDLNRDLRDKDFKYNYEEKLKIVERAEQLPNEEDFQKAYSELQQLHHIWKEELGPVSKEHRQSIWERFSAATKVMHDKKQEFQKERDTIHQKLLEQKKDLLGEIRKISSEVGSTHQQIQAQIRSIQKAKDKFYEITGVPYALQKPLISELKKINSDFNKSKNLFYKEEKKRIQDRIAQKKALIQIAQELKDTEDFEETTKTYISIQKQWREIGAVPKKISDSLWKEFKAACNHYFDRLHSQNKQERKELHNTKNAELSELDKVHKERSFILNQIKEVEGEIRQLETNIDFFNGSNDNPLLKSVVKDLESKKGTLEKLQLQLKDANVQRNKLQKAEEESHSDEAEPSDLDNE